MKRKCWLLLVVLMVFTLVACRDEKGATHSDMNDEQHVRIIADYGVAAEQQR